MTNTPIPKVYKSDISGKDVFVAQIENELAVANYMHDDEGQVFIEISIILQGISSEDNVRERRHTQYILSPQGVMCLYDALRAIMSEPRFMDEYKNQRVKDADYQLKVSQCKQGEAK
jgi:hypothetical protein